MAKAATTVPPPPTDPVELLSTPLLRSGLTAAAQLRRAGARIGLGTVRDLLFHLPRRYDDLREMQKLGDLVWTEEGAVVSARVRVAEIHVEPTFRRRVQRTVARLEDETGSIEATWFGRRYIERRLHGRQPGGGLRTGQALRSTADVRQPRVPGRRGRRHRGAPRRAHRPRLPAHGRADRRSPALGHARGARPGRVRLPGIPARCPPEDGVADRDRDGPRAGPLPSHLRGPRCGARPPGLRRAARAPDRDGRATPPACPCGGAGHRHRRRHRRRHPPCPE